MCLGLCHVDKPSTKNLDLLPRSPGASRNYSKLSVKRWLRSLCPDMRLLSQPDQSHREPRPACPLLEGVFGAYPQPLTVGIPGRSSTHPPPASSPGSSCSVLFVAQADLHLWAVLPQPLVYRGDRCVPACPAPCSLLALRAAIWAKAGGTAQEKLLAGVGGTPVLRLPFIHTCRSHLWELRPSPHVVCGPGCCTVRASAPPPSPTWGQSALYRREPGQARPGQTGQGQSWSTLGCQCRDIGYQLAIWGPMEKGI